MHFSSKKKKKTGVGNDAVGILDTVHEQISNNPGHVQVVIVNGNDDVIRALHILCQSGEFLRR